MSTTSEIEALVADRVWIATALLHQRHPERESFTKKEIREAIEGEGLAQGVERGTLSAHIDQHCVANVAPSSGKYRMIFEVSPGNLRLFCPGDHTHPGRIQKRKPSKSVPQKAEISPRYWYLLDWYEMWSKSRPYSEATSWEDDPLIRLIGSGRHIWADEHADEYVNRLREEDPL